jgi:uncharacterized protein (TIGR02246 family)
MAGSDDDVNCAEVRTVAEEWTPAIVSNDADRMAGFMADDWVMVSDSGVSPRQEFLAVVQSGQLTHSAMQLVSEPRVRCYGETAVMTGRVTNTAHYGGQRFDADEWTTDVFVRRQGRWTCVLSHTTTASRDGDTD